MRPSVKALFEKSIDSRSIMTSVAAVSLILSLGCSRETSVVDRPASEGYGVSEGAAGSGVTAAEREGLGADHPAGRAEDRAITGAEPSTVERGSAPARDGAGFDQSTAGPTSRNRTRTTDEQMARESESSRRESRDRTSDRASDRASAEGTTGGSDRVLSDEESNTEVSGSENDDRALGDEGTASGSMEQQENSDRESSGDTTRNANRRTQRSLTDWEIGPQ